MVGGRRERRWVAGELGEKVSLWWVMRDSRGEGFDGGGGGLVGCIIGVDKNILILKVAVFIYGERK